MDKPGAMAEAIRLAAGDRAPSFCLPSQYSSVTCLESLADKVSIVYFYPKDMTPGCTLEATDLNEIGDQLRDLHIGLGDALATVATLSLGDPAQRTHTSMRDLGSVARF